MNLQSYALTGRKTKPDYVGAINAQTKFLPEKKRLKDEEEYRNKLLAQNAEEFSANLGLAKDKLNYENNQSGISTAIGLGNLGLNTYFGRKKDEALSKLIPDDGGKAEGAVSPMSTGEYGQVNDTSGLGEFGEVTSPESTSGVLEGIKGIEWGPTVSSTLVGAPVGAQLAKTFIDDTKISKGLTSAVVGAGLSYLATSDPYSAAVSGITSGILGAFL